VNQSTTKKSPFAFYSIFTTLSWFTIELKLHKEFFHNFWVDFMSLGAMYDSLSSCKSMIMHYFNSFYASSKLNMIFDTQQQLGVTHCSLAIT